MANLYVRWCVANVQTGDSTHYVETGQSAEDASHLLPALLNNQMGIVYGLRFPYRAFPLIIYSSDSVLCPPPVTVTLLIPSRKDFTTSLGASAGIGYSWARSSRAKCSRAISQLPVLATRMLGSYPRCTLND